MSRILEYVVVYLLCVYIYSAGYYVELPIVLLYEVSILMLGVSHVIQSKKL